MWRWTRRATPFTLYNVGSEPADPFHQIRLMGFNPNGTVRSGFPVSIKVATGRVISALRLTVDALGNIQIFGAASNLSNFGIMQGSYTVVHGSEGTLAAATREFSLSAPAGATSVDGRDMGLDFAGDVYFSATWFSNGTPGFGGKVLSFSATAPGARAGFPKELTGATFIGSRVNSVANTPMLLVPVLGGPAYPFETQLSAYNAISGDMQPGFPITFTDVVGVSRSVADIAGNAWVLGPNTPAGAVLGHNKDLGGQRQRKRPDARGLPTGLWRRRRHQRRTRWHHGRCDGHGLRHWCPGPAERHHRCAAARLRHAHAWAVEQQRVEAASSSTL